MTRNTLLSWVILLTYYQNRWIDVPSTKYTAINLLLHQQSKCVKPEMDLDFVKRKTWMPNSAQLKL